MQINYSIDTPWSSLMTGMSCLGKKMDTCHITSLMKMSPVQSQIFYINHKNKKANLAFFSTPSFQLDPLCHLHLCRQLYPNSWWKSYFGSLLTPFIQCVCKPRQNPLLCAGWSLKVQSTNQNWSCAWTICWILIR